MARLRDAAAAFAAVAAGWIIFPHDASAYEIDPWLGNTLSGASQTSGGTQTSFSASASYIDLGYGSFNDSASANLATGQLNASSANSTTGPIHFLGIAGSFVNDRLTILGNWTGTIPVSVTLAAQASFSGLGTPTYAQGYGSVSALASLPGNVAESATSIVSLGYKLGSTFVVPSSFPAPQASGGASVSSKIISLNSTAATFTVTDTILVSDTNPGCCPVSGPSVLS